MVTIKENLRTLVTKFKDRNKIAPDARANFEKTVAAAKEAATKGQKTKV